MLIVLGLVRESEVLHWARNKLNLLNYRHVYRPRHPMLHVRVRRSAWPRYHHHEVAYSIVIVLRDLSLLFEGQHLKMLISLKWRQLAQKCKE